MVDTVFPVKGEVRHCKEFVIEEKKDERVLYSCLHKNQDEKQEVKAERRRRRRRRYRKQSLAIDLVEIALSTMSYDMTDVLI